MADATERVKKVQHLYEAFGRGDVEALMAQLSPDVEWSAPDMTDTWSGQPTSETISLTKRGRGSLHR
jgi:ketosteroid isomerase-like protein